VNSTSMEETANAAVMESADPEVVARQRPGQYDAEHAVDQRGIRKQLILVVKSIFDIPGRYKYPGAPLGSGAGCTPGSRPAA